MTQHQWNEMWAIFQWTWVMLIAKECQESMFHFKFYTPVIWKGDRVYFLKPHWRFWLPAAAAAKSLQSCLTLCNPIDGSPPGSAARGILQAKTLEWVAISFSNAWKWKMKVKSLSRVWLLATPCAMENQQSNRPESKCTNDCLDHPAAAVAAKSL